MRNILLGQHNVIATKAHCDSVSLTQPDRQRERNRRGERGKKKEIPESHAYGGQDIINPSSDSPSRMS